MAGKNAKWGSQLIKAGDLEIQGDAGNAKWTGLVVKNTATHANGETGHGVEISMQMQAYEAGSRDYRPAARIIAIKGTGNDWFTGGASTNFQGQLYFQTRQNDVMQTGLQIDNGGRVTTPLQPSFLCRPTNGYDITSDEVITGTWYDGPHGWNTGGHFNLTNGRFTAPVTGKYFIHWTALVSTSSGRTDAFLQKNGSEVYRAEINGYNATQTNRQGSITAIMDLAANDYVNFGLRSDSGSPSEIYGGNRAPWSYATGYLLG